MQKISLIMKRSLVFFCVTETSLGINEIDLPKSAQTEGYKPISTATLSQKGGA